MEIRHSSVNLAAAQNFLTLVCVRLSSSVAHSRIAFILLGSPVSDPPPPPPYTHWTAPWVERFIVNMKLPVAIFPGGKKRIASRIGGSLKLPGLPLRAGGGALVLKGKV